MHAKLHWTTGPRNRIHCRESPDDTMWTPQLADMGNGATIPLILRPVVTCDTLTLEDLAELSGGLQLHGKGRRPSVARRRVLFANVVTNELRFALMRVNLLYVTAGGLSCLPLLLSRKIELRWQPQR